MPADILERIIERKRQDLAACQQRLPLDALRERLADAAPPRDFVGALRRASHMGLIAEVKKASPSAGVIREDFDPVQIARAYEAHGANCISVLTDEPFFQGKLDDLIAVRRAVSIPVIRKDFLIDPYQVIEARVAGADCVLLIAECLSDADMSLLFETAADLGMACLIELYDPENLPRVLRLAPPLVGVNNRDLRSFVVDLNHSLTIRPQVPEQAVFVSESGIRTPADVALLADHGVNAILVGESLMRQPDVGAAIDTLLSQVR
ncbi:MAG: indole-3-glycerol phosphate synthase TrpC [Planctomycetaceae bacterium]|nr:indole-3-glycerol phosphate synthase TrpC [Planctomycetaceae bacterium]